MVSNIINFCQQFYASTFIPILYFRYPDEIQWSCPYVLKDMSVQNTAMQKKIKFYKNPDYYITDSYAYFGFININKSPSKMDFIVLGPVYSTPISEESLHNFLRECQLTGDSRDEMARVLLNSPQITFHQFLNILSFIHLCINNGTIDVESHFNARFNASVQHKISGQYSVYAYDRKENGEYHNTYDFEQTLTDCISHGDVARLQSTLKHWNQESPIKSGTLSSNILRHTRNLFIVTATLATRAAVAGGLDIEQAYSLSDLYIRECENTQNVDVLNSLTYTMLIDFTTRVGNQKFPIEGMSKEVFQCVQYISQHTNSALLVDDVAASIGKSRSYITKKFKTELGFDISSFIMRCKLEEAKSLLTYTDKSLSDISNYLCFSSQSYFQNVFKKQYGITPMAYRKKTTHSS